MITMQKSESIKNLAVALSKFQSEVENPKNTADNPFYKSKYAPLQDVLNTVRPLLSKHGLSVIQSPAGDGESVSIMTMLLHESGEWIEFDPIVLKAEKMTPQGAGSAITYGRRYALSAVLGISSEDDDDANSLENTKRAPDKAEKKDVSALSTLKAKWQTLAGDLTGFDDWFKEQKEKGYNQHQMNRFLTMKLKEKQEEKVS